MQTFMPFQSFYESFNCLDDKRLSNQRNETLVILKALQTGPIQTYIPKGQLEPSTRKTPWYNHPIIQMWKGYEWFLIQYGKLNCQYCIERGIRDTLMDVFREFEDTFPFIVDKEVNPEWWGNPLIHNSHKVNLLKKDYGYYHMHFGIDILVKKINLGMFTHYYDPSRKQYFYFVNKKRVYLDK